MNTEQERAEFEAWMRDNHPGHRLIFVNGYLHKWPQRLWEAYQAGRAALQSQATEAFPCRIVEADFEAGTVTLEMQGDYTVSSGQKYLCDAPLQSQDREDAGYESGRRCGLGFAHSVVSEILRKHYHGSGVEGLNKLIQQAADVIATEMDNPTTATTDIDHARRVEGEGE